MNEISKFNEILDRMDSETRQIIIEKGECYKLWENTFIKRQIDKRKRNDGGQFDMKDHICAMVYAMLSSGVSWERIAENSGIDPETGRLIPIDNIFCNYDIDRLLQCLPEELRDEIKKNQMRRLFHPEANESIAGNEYQ